MRKIYARIDQSPVIQIFKKKCKRPFCEIEVPNEDYLSDLSPMINSTAKFILIGDLLIDKSEIDYIIIKKN